MKLTYFLSLFLSVSAFGVNPSPRTSIAVKKGSSSSATNSPLFRDPSKVRGGAVPGWAAYNDALDNKPLLTKSMTSLVGWALGDMLTQVRRIFC